MSRASWVSDDTAAEPGRRGTGVAIACDGVARVWVDAPAFESSRVRPLKVVETVVAAAEAESRSVSGWRRWVSEPCALGARDACDAPDAAEAGVPVVPNGVPDVLVPFDAVGAEVCRDNLPEPDFDP